VTFTGPVLTQAVEVVGAPVLELAHDSDNPHADLYVRLCEVDAKGRSWNVSERYVRLSGQTGVLRLELSPTAHCFRPGTRIRLQVSGGSHPQHDRNLGTGEPPATGTAMRPSHRTIELGGGASVLTLPVSS
jgi:putative CocE/NonD family hydrolase